MRTRTIALLSIVLLSLVMVPQFDAAPGGIGSAGDNGCSCHGGPSSDTVVSVTGLPETYNSSETYTFTVTPSFQLHLIQEFFLHPRKLVALERKFYHHSNNHYHYLHQNDRSFLQSMEDNLQCA